MRHKTRLSLKFKIIIIILLISVIPLLVFAITSITVNKFLFTSKVTTINTKLLTQLSFEIQHRFTTLEKSIVTLCNDKVIQHISNHDYKINSKGKTIQYQLVIDALQNLINSQSPLLASICIYGYDTGNFFQRGLSTFESDYTNTNWAQDSINNPDSFIYYPSAKKIKGHYTTDIPLITMNRVFSDPNTKKPILFVRVFIDSKQVSKILQSAFYGKNSRVVITNSDFTPILHIINNKNNDTHIIDKDNSTKSNLNKFNTVLKKIQLKSKDNGLDQQESKIVKISTKEYIITHSNVNLNNWKIFSLIPIKNITAESSLMSIVIGLILGVLVIVSFIISFKLFSINVITPVTRLMKLSTEINNEIIGKYKNNKEISNGIEPDDYKLPSNQFEWEMIKNVLFNLEIELKNNYNVLRQVQKLDMVGTLAAGISHDFNNILGGIVSIISLVDTKMKYNEEISKEDLLSYFNIIKQSITKASNIVKQLLSLSKKHTLELKPINIDSVINSTLKLCKSSFDKIVSIQYLSNEKNPMTLGDETQLEQVLLNLFVNGYHSMTIMRKNTKDYGGKLTISINSFTPNENFKEKYDNVKEKYWNVKIHDTGIGMSNKIISQIFNPFYTTKGKTVGTGLGLSMVQNIVNSLNGMIEVQSKVGEGSTFCVYLPIYQAEPKQNSIEKNKLTKGNGTILFCEDEDLIRNTQKYLLEKNGYLVYGVNDGAKAVFEYNKHKKELDLVILDAIMPGISGLELYKIFLQQNPLIKIIITSGSDDDKRIQDAIKEGIKFLKKPYTIEQLLNTINEILNKK